MQSATGKPFTPTSEMMQIAHNGQGLNGAPAPSVASAQIGQAAHVYVTQSGHGTGLFAPAQNGNN